MNQPRDNQLKRVARNSAGDARWITELKSRLQLALARDVTLASFYKDVADDTCSLHLAVFVEPYLEYVLDGRKTIESRFSVNRCLPYRGVRPGDILLLKAAAGPVVGICRIEHVWYYTLNPNALRDIQQTFTAELCAQDPDFWARRARAAYATLMRVVDVSRLGPIATAKRDRRGWVTLNRELQLSLMDDAPSAPEATSDRELAARPLTTAPIRTLLMPPEEAITIIRCNDWRNSWWFRPLDPRAQHMLLSRSIPELQDTIRKRLRQSVGRVYDLNGILKPYRDGYQTPLSGNIVFYAQHATATCCRRFIEDWFALPNGRDLSTDELEWLTLVSLQYIVDRRQELMRNHE